MLRINFTALFKSSKQFKTTKLQFNGIYCNKFMKRFKGEYFGLMYVQDF